MLRVQPTAELDPLERETLSNFERDGLRDTQFVKSDPIDRARAAERGWERKLLDFEIPQASPAQTYEAVLDSTAGFTKCSEACAYFYKLALQQGVEFHFGSEKGAFDSIVEEIDSPSHLKKAVGVKTKDGVLHKADVVAICGLHTPFCHYLRGWATNVQQLDPSRRSYCLICPITLSRLQEA